jgi:tetratricopeptide (TPR) repeat protein
MASTEELTDRARRAYASRSWVIARDAYEAARSSEPLGPDDLYALSNCHWWLGDLAAALPLQREAYAAYLELDAPADAALVALDHAYTLSLRGDEAQASGWLGRVDHLLEGCPEGLAHGYRLHVGFEDDFEGSDLEAALQLSLMVHALGERLGAAGLVALGLLGKGRVLLRRGEVARGMRLLDQAMLGAVADDMDPGWSGNIYCHLMTACNEIGDLRRAGEWTEATARWCESMPGAGPFMGICRVHRAQVLQVRGDWDGALREATRVTSELIDLDVPVVAEAHYLLGDLLRLRGRMADAEAAFLEGHRLGRDPQPGLALLRLAIGEVETAISSIRASLVGAGTDTLARARLLPAAIEVALAAGDLEQAGTWGEELSSAAEL